MQNLDDIKLIITCFHRVTYRQCGDYSFLAAGSHTFLTIGNFAISVVL